MDHGEIPIHLSFSLSLSVEVGRLLCHQSVVVSFFHRLLFCTLRLVGGLYLLGEEVITSSDPISNTTPVVLETVFDAENVETVTTRSSPLRCFL